jgi:hypothetical protein
MLIPPFPIVGEGRGHVGRAPRVRTGHRGVAADRPSTRRADPLEQVGELRAPATSARRLAGPGAASRPRRRRRAREGEAERLAPAA